MRFGEVIQALMAGGGNAVWRGEWDGLAMPAVPTGAAWGLATMKPF